jgi:hypothetical protein
MALKELIETGRVTPAIDRTFSLSEAPKAIRYLEEGHARGKSHNNCLGVVSKESSRMSATAAATRKPLVVLRMGAIKIVLSWIGVTHRRGSHGT